MSTLDVIDRGRAKIKTVELSDNIFAVEPNSSLVHSAVVMQRASLRQGTAATRGRGEVSGSGRKPWKQKHTGRARAGSNRSPIWRHGGTVFGPKPRKYGFRMPKKMYRAAMRGVLSSKYSEGAIVVLAEDALPEPKTKIVAKILKDLNLVKKTLIVAGEHSDDWRRAGKNIPGVKVVLPQELNVYDLLNHDALLVLDGQMEKIQEFWS